MQIIDFEKSTIRELEDRFRETAYLHNGLDEILKEILILKDEFYVAGTPNASRLYHNLIKSPAKDKIGFIYSFLINNYPSKLLDEIKNKKDALDKKTKKEEKRIAEAFAALAKKEELLNQAITNSIKNKE